MSALPLGSRPTLPYAPTPCPACGAAEAVEIAAHADIRRELERLWEFHTRRLRGGAPAAALTDRLAFSQDPPLRLVRCNCGTVYRNPAERDAAVTELYADEEPDMAALTALFETQRRFYRRHARELTRLYGRRGSGLELGSYVGGFLAAAREQGWRIRGLDVNPRANAVARSHGLSVDAGMLVDEPGAKTADVVAIWNCLDQLPDPAATLRAAHRLLRAGGLLGLRVPSGAFYARLRDRIHGRAGGLAAALLAQNNLLGFPYRTGFSAASLRALVERSGFEVARERGDALVPLGGGWSRPWATAEAYASRLLLRALAWRGTAPWLEVWAWRR